ncbi:hypothetical protein NIES4103_25030 [Nostoc sp. NIES-4103]|nr:hypothetical protein NIES4103_25030 [Nostoc sp. NIES-4103]
MKVNEKLEYSKLIQLRVYKYPVKIGDKSNYAYWN